MSGKGGIVIGSQIERDLVLRPDACIVGSGPGGAMMASRLARAGVSVVVIEEGGYHTRDEFDMQEATAFPRLYQDRGNRATADLSIAILQGRAVGGGTVVNWTTSYRTPDDVLRHSLKVFRMRLRISWVVIPITGTSPTLMIASGGLNAISTATMPIRITASDAVWRMPELSRLLMALTSPVMIDISRPTLYRS